MKDIVYCLREDLPLNGEELRYSLRSLKNMLHGKVWMYTPRLPDWVNPDKVGHIEWTEIKTDNKYDDLMGKWKSFPELDFLPQHFTYMDDDMYIVQPGYKPKAVHNSPLRLMLRVLQDIQNKTLAKYDVLETMVKVYDLLRSKGIQKPLSPVQHIPWPVNRKNIPVHWDDGNGPYEFKTLCYNYRNPRPSFQYGEPKAKTAESLQRIIDRGDPVISSDDPPKFQTSGFQAWLEQAFPEPSKYEL